MSYVKIGVAGPVGSGKTALIEALSRKMAKDYSIGVITNDIYTKEDAQFLAKNSVLPVERIIGVETGGCPHTAIREDASMNLEAVDEMMERFPDIELLFIESGGDNLSATFSPELVDATIFVIDVAEGDKIPRKGGPGITRSDLLVINKIDTVKKEDILKTIETYKDAYHFKEVIPVSAMKKTNTDTLIHTIFQYLPEGPQYYDEDTVTDQPMRQSAAELIREKARRMMSDEIPHGIAVTIERMTERDNGIFDIDATIICERESHKGIVIGKGGQMLKRIGTSARIEIENLMDTKVNLKLWVKVRKEWRDSELYMKNYGYNSKDI